MSHGHTCVTYLMYTCTFIHLAACVYTWLLLLAESSHLNIVIRAMMFFLMLILGLHMGVAKKGTTVSKSQERRERERERDREEITMTRERERARER